MTEPTIESDAKEICEWVLHYYGYQPTGMSQTEKWLYKLASELAAIRSQPVPVEPWAITQWIRNKTGRTPLDTAILDYIDALQSALRVAQQERDEALLKFDVAENNFIGAREALINEGKRNKRLVEALRVCRTALHETCHLPREYDMNSDPDSITLKTGRAFALADSILVDDDAELLREIDNGQ